MPFSTQLLAVCLSAIAWSSQSQLSLRVCSTQGGAIEFASVAIFMGPRLPVAPKQVVATSAGGLACIPIPADGAFVLISKSGFQSRYVAADSLLRDGETRILLSPLVEMCGYVDGLEGRHGLRIRATYESAAEDVLGSWSLTVPSASAVADISVPSASSGAKFCLVAPLDARIRLDLEGPEGFLATWRDVAWDGTNGLRLSYQERVTLECSEEGRPIAHGLVFWLVPIDLGAQGRYLSAADGEFATAIQSDVQGCLDLSYVERGQWLLGVAPGQGYAPIARPVSLGLSGHFTPMQYQLRKGVMLQGRVIGVPEGSRGAILNVAHCDEPSLALHVQTASDGSFEVGPLSANCVKLFASSGVTFASSKAVVVSLPSADPVVLTLASGAIVQGVLSGPGIAGRVTYQLSKASTDPGWGFFQLDGAAGDWRFEGVPPGRYMLVASQREAVLACSQVEVDCALVELPLVVGERGRAILRLGDRLGVRHVYVNQSEFLVATQEIARGAQLVEFVLPYGEYEACVVGASPTSPPEVVKFVVGAAAQEIDI